MGWLIWLGVALVLAATEVATLAFVGIMLAGGALIGALAAAAGPAGLGPGRRPRSCPLLLLTMVRKSALARWMPEGRPSVGVAA